VTPEERSIQIRRRLSDTLTGVLQEFGEFTMKWVVLAETVGEDSRPSLWMATADEARPWDTMGMLTFALQLEVRAIDDTTTQT
jgi:hypothetical protein